MIKVSSDHDGLIGLSWLTHFRCGLGQVKAMDWAPSVYRSLIPVSKKGDHVFHFGSRPSYSHYSN